MDDDQRGDDAVLDLSIRSSESQLKVDDAVPETGRESAEDTTAAEDEAEVWQSFEQSVAYMRNLSALYKDAFLTPTKKTAVPTVAHLHAAKEHAREALELLASNVLNASTAIVATLENQEEELAVIDATLDRVKQRLRHQDEMHDQEIVRLFFASNESRGLIPPSNIRRADERSGSLKLTLTGSASSTSSASQSSYLYL